MASAASTRMSAGRGNERFNEEAAAWDKAPFVRAQSAEAWTTLQKRVPYFNGENPKDPDVMELGCGTGLLSFMVAPRAGRFVAVDAAEGMIDVLKSKLTAPDAPKNITPVCVLLEDPEDAQMPPADPTVPDGARLKFDLITSHLVLHHIPDLKVVLKTMLGCLKSGGMVALTDFEDFGSEASRFHPQSRMAGVERHGIQREWFAKLMEEVGFSDVRVEVGWQSMKRVERFAGEFKLEPIGHVIGEEMIFPFLICIGVKP